VWVDARFGIATDVRAQRYDSQGAPQGVEFGVNLGPNSGDSQPAVAAAADGRFVVTWSGSSDFSGPGIFARRFPASGAYLYLPFQVNTYTTGRQYQSAIATDASGDFVIVWTDSRPPGSSNVFGQRFTASGVRRGAEFQVSDTLVDFQDNASVASDADGDFVVAWSARGYTAPRIVEWTIAARRFDAAGQAGGSFTVVPYSTVPKFGPAVASDAHGGWFVAWQRNGGPSDIFAQRYDPSGLPRGGEFQVSPSLGVAQTSTAVASDRVGRVVVTWTSGFADSDILGQRYARLAPVSMAVDTSPSPASNGNRILEPGESVDVRPSWSNATGSSQTFTGTVQSFSGPPGAGYNVLDGTGAYGALPPGTTAGCTDCYGVQVTPTGPRPATHWDATLPESLMPGALGEAMTWTMHIGRSFQDVPNTSFYYRHVEALLHRGITAGCAADRYCPDSATTREQMAAFVLLAKEGTLYEPPACSPPNVFADVPETSPFCDVIEELERRGVVSGCGGGFFCPTGPVPRDQMAVFVLLTFDPTFVAPSCTTPVFADVPANSPYCRWIEELARRGIVGGCGGGLYCPAAPVTREQMAVFLAGTFGLTPYGP
jgi:hypothetical protein